MPRAVTGQDGLQPSESTPAATSKDTPAATGNDAGDTRPRAVPLHDEQDQQAWQEWADVDVSGTVPLPVIPAAPAHLADVTATSPQSASNSGSWRSPLKTLRTRHPKSAGPGTEVTPVLAETGPTATGDQAAAASADETAVIPWDAFRLANKSENRPPVADDAAAADTSVEGIASQPGL